MFKKVLLPVDGPIVHEHTWDYAKQLINKENANIEVLYVNEDIWMNSEKTQCNDGMCKSINLFDLCDSPIVDIDDSHKKKKEDVICEIKTAIQSYFGDSSQNITMHVVNGKPAHKILTVSKDQNFDLVIMSTHHINTLKKITLGSVTNKVVNHSEVPVLVIR